MALDLTPQLNLAQIAFGIAIIAGALVFIAANIRRWLHLDDRQNRK
jgi:hypothetical protein